MTEKEELAQAKLKLDLKYGRVAKKRLLELSKIISSDKSLIDLSDQEFVTKLNWLKQKLSKKNPKNNN